ncbi:MCE family protein [Nocardia sp. BSTN01]|uniref:MCE family protein n=1 Tax=Nocardia sp. BSTN01 TaxID=2783665 RepID=UPI00188DE4F6|nr:MCE family protein [Nocardia sp. BSTN01]MBF4997301.1 MCE family protein [Nocardia sp. BSTN01]
MRITGHAVKFTIFIVTMSLFLFAIVTVFGNLRFDRETEYHAVFENVSGLRSGQFVRIAGVESGRVRKVSVTDNTKALITFSVAKDVVLTGGTRAVVRYENLVGDRYLELLPGAGASTPLRKGATIGLDRTAPALDIDALVGGFRPLFRALDPDQVNKLSSELIAVLQGQNADIVGFLSHTASLTSTLADRDKLIGSVIGNLNGLLGTIDGKNGQFDALVDNVQKLISGISAQTGPVGDALVHIGEASKSVADLLNVTHTDIKSDIDQIGRVSTNIDDDHEYLDTLLSQLPDRYQRLSRLGIYGDFFSFYLCDATLKVNGPHGDPVFINIVGQRAGRCTPPK